MKNIFQIMVFALVLTFGSVSWAQNVSFAGVKVGYSKLKLVDDESLDFLNGEITGGVSYGIEYLSLNPKGLGLSVNYSQYTSSVSYEGFGLNGDTDVDLSAIGFGMLYPIKQENNASSYLGLEYIITSSEASIQVEGREWISSSGDGAMYGLVGGTIISSNDKYKYHVGIRAFGPNTDFISYEVFFSMGF